MNTPQDDLQALRNARNRVTNKFTETAEIARMAEQYGIKKGPRAKTVLALDEELKLRIIRLKEQHPEVS